MGKTSLNTGLTVTIVTTLLLGCGGEGGEERASAALQAGPAAAQQPGAAAGIAFGYGGRIHLMRPDGAGRRRLTGGRLARDAPSDSQPAWSPDGSTLAFARAFGPEEGSTAIYLVEPYGGRRARRLDLGRDVSSPAWSPDGRRLAFVRYSGGAMAIVVAGLDGSGERVLRSVPERPEEPLFLGDPAWSPDGERIAYTLTRLDRRYTFRPSLHTMDANGGDDRLLARDARQAAWSPDGSRIAFASIRDRNGRRCWDQCNVWAELYVMDADGSDPIRLTRNKGDDSAPSWSPGGERIAFASDRNYPGIARSEVYSIRPDGSCLTWLTNGSPSSGEPAWRPSPGASTDPGACGATRRAPALEVDLRGLRRPGRDPAYWLGKRHGPLLIGGAEVTRDGRSLSSYHVHYDDCARYRPRRCPPELQLQQTSVCSRSGLSILRAVRDRDFRRHVRVFARHGLLLVDIGQSDLTVVAGRAQVRIFHSTSRRRGRRQTLAAMRALRRVGRPEGAGLPPPALPPEALSELRRRFPATMRALPGVRTAACPARR